LRIAKLAYAEKRDGNLTGFWYGEVVIKATDTRFRSRLEVRKDTEARIPSRF
jgi:hypothetical protein